MTSRLFQSSKTSRRSTVAGLLASLNSGCLPMLAEASTVTEALPKSLVPIKIGGRVTAARTAADLHRFPYLQLVRVVSDERSHHSTGQR